jgi:3,2-trans-enoyl-CoA isomerase
MIVTTDHVHVRELRLSRPPVNALNRELIVALRDAVARAHQDRCGAIVLSGAPGRFSGGLDVPELLRLDRAQLRETWAQFFGLLRDLAFSELPVVAALTGHSPAGGTVLALFADYRVLAEGPHLVGLNEVQVGLAVPEVLFRALSHLVGPRHAGRLAMTGALISPAEALSCGLVDDVVPVADVVSSALSWAFELLARPVAARTTTRRLARRPLHDAFAAVDPGFVDAVTAEWFSAETQAALHALIAKLAKR